MADIIQPGTPAQPNQVPVADRVKAIQLKRMTQPGLQRQAPIDPSVPAPRHDPEFFRNHMDQPIPLVDKAGNPTGQVAPKPSDTSWINNLDVNKGRNVKLDTPPVKKVGIAPQHLLLPPDEARRRAVEKETFPIHLMTDNEFNSRKERFKAMTPEDQAKRDPRSILEEKHEDERRQHPWLFPRSRWAAENYGYLSEEEKKQRDEINARLGKEMSDYDALHPRAPQPVDPRVQALIDKHRERKLARAAKASLAKQASVPAPAAPAAPAPVKKKTSVGDKILGGYRKVPLGGQIAHAVINPITGIPMLAAANWGKIKKTGRSIGRGFRNIGKGIRKFAGRAVGGLAKAFRRKK
jgi:hypothetical protein